MNLARTRDVHDRRHQLLADLTSILLDLHPPLPRGWARPLDLGGSNSSHHHRDLTALTRMGLVERELRSHRRSYKYRITLKGYMIHTNGATMHYQDGE